MSELEPNENEEICPWCNGSGYAGTDSDCGACNGDGIVRKSTHTPKPPTSAERRAIPWCCWYCGSAFSTLAHLMAHEAETHLLKKEGTK